MLPGCRRPTPPAPASGASEESLRGAVERAAVQALPPPAAMADFDFEVLCAADQLDLKRDALLAKARELGGTAIEGLRDSERVRRISLKLPGSAVAPFRAYAGVAPGTVPPGEREIFDVTLRAP